MTRITGVAVILAMSMALMGGCGFRSQAGDLIEEEMEDEDQSEFKDLDDRFSYAYGADLAKQFRVEGIELNAELLAAGMLDVYGGGETKMSAGEIAATIELYTEIHKQRREEARAVIAEKNKAEGAAFLAENAKREGVAVTESGLQYRIITEGNGDYRPTENDEVTVHYRGTLVDGTEFDSTYERGPYTAKVLQLVDGWYEALQLMTVGSKWELYVPAELAYGDEGSQYVGPNAVLIFEVELLDVEKYDPERYELEMHEPETG